MKTARRTLVVFLSLALAAAAWAQVIPAEAGLRYSAEVSNSPVGSCGCFTMQGAAADLNWNLIHFNPTRRAGSSLGLAADFGAENTRNENGFGYGLTLSTFAAGLRFKLPGRRVQTFAQALFGLARGTGSSFPENGVLVRSANSFALDLGAAASYPLNRRVSMRFLELDYLRTALPNNSSNWQNNLRLGAGITLSFAPAKIGG